MRHLSDQNRTARAEQFLATVSAELHVPAAPKPDELPPLALRILVRAALAFGIFLTALYTDLNISPTAGKRAVDLLIARNLIRLVPVSRKGRGGRPVIIAILLAGKAELDQRGIEIDRGPLKGGAKHSFFGLSAGRRCKAQGFPYWYERTLNDGATSKQFDLVFQDAAGSLRAIEVITSGSPKHNAEGILRGASIPGIAEVIYACETKKAIDAIRGEIQEIDALGLYRGKTTGQLVGEYVG